MFCILVLACRRNIGSCSYQINFLKDLDTLPTGPRLNPASLLCAPVLRKVPTSIPWVVFARKQGEYDWILDMIMTY